MTLSNSDTFQSPESTGLVDVKIYSWAFKTKIMQFRKSEIEKCSVGWQTEGQIAHNYTNFMLQEKLIYFSIWKKDPNYFIAL